MESLTSPTDSSDKSSKGVAIVTGGAAGIGYACCERLGRSGHSIVVADINSSAVDNAASELRTAGILALGIQVDVTEPAQIATLVQQAVDWGGDVDVLVNSAGRTRLTPLLEVTEVEWDETFAINAKGSFFMLQEVARRMVPRGRGSIVNISSLAGKGWRNASNVAYAASKASVITMTRIAAAQLGEHGVRVNAVCPGMTKTDMNRSWLRDRAAAEGLAEHELEKELAAGSSLKRLNSPSDVADAVAFLASDQSRNITGQSINVDSGTVWD